MVKGLRAALAVLAALAAGALIATPARATDEAEGVHYLATYHGRIIDLAVSWEGAQACAITDIGNACFDSEAEMNASIFVDVASAVRGLADLVALSTCSSATTLYDNTGFVGPLVTITTRNTVIQLSSLGFSAKTSSYKIGPCAAIFYDAGGSTYPGSTAAFATASSMASGWNNRVTQVYLT